MSRKPHPPLPTRGLLPLVALVGMVALIVWCMEPPPAQPLDAPARWFSAARALAQVRQIARLPHPPGSAEHGRVREYITGEFRRISLDVRVQTTTAWRSQRGFVQAAQVENIIARLPGRGTGKAVMLSAHYDSHPTGPGAGDDGAGVATLLETARALMTNPKPARDILFVVTDAEEWGLIGAEGFVRDAPEAQNVAAVLNFEARGASGPVFMFETSDGNGALVGELARAAPRPLASSLMYSLYKLLPNDTDLTVFKEAGLSGLNFAFAGRWPAYHTVLDTPDKLDLRSVQHHGEYALSVTRRLSSNTDTPQPRGDAAYFDVLSRGLLHYPLAWTPALAAVAAALLIAAIVRWRKEDGFFRAWGIGVAVLPLTIVIGGAVAYGFGLAIAPLQVQTPWSDPYDARLLGAALFALAGGAVWLVWAMLPARFSARPLLLGALVWWGALSILTAAVLPGAAYLFVWPLILVAASTLLRRPVFVLIAGLLSLVLTVPVLHGLALLLGFGLPPALGILCAIVAAPLVSLLRYSRAHAARNAVLGPVAALLAGLVAVGIAYARNTPSADRPRTNTLLYFEDADQSAAQWVSADQQNDVWTAPFLRDARPIDGSQVFPWSRRRLRAADTTPLSLPAPEVIVNGDRVTIRSRRGATELVVSGAGIRGVTLNGERLPPQFGTFCLRFLAPPADGIALDIDAPAGTRVTIDDYADGLPPGTPPRPAHLIPQPLAPMTDRTIVRTQVTLQGAPSR